jgi:hypothetical protein
MASKRTIRGRDKGIVPFVSLNTDSLDKVFNFSVGDEHTYDSILRELVHRHPMIRKIVQDSYPGHVDQLLLINNLEDLRWYSIAAVKLLSSQGLEFNFNGDVVQDSLGHVIPVVGRTSISHTSGHSSSSK